MMAGQDQAAHLGTTALYNAREAQMNEAQDWRRAYGFLVPARPG
jgi:hypothetical protein